MACSCGAGSALLLRVTIFIGLASVVTTIIYFTPVPNPYYASCDRPCHELDWPMICRFKLSLEVYESMGAACGQCPANASHCGAAQCVPGDGSRRVVMAANRMLPGPLMKVCENDIVLVDVVNRAAGQAVGVHWGGQSQREFPYMDGVPQVTQCPINTHTTFQYKFRASEAGTHLWAATGSPQAESVFGPLVVQQSNARDPHRQLYDEDVHVLSVSAFGSAILVNGHREHQAAALVRGRRYRLRLLHAGGTPDADAADHRAGPGLMALPGAVTVSAAGLPMLVLAVDGRPVRTRSTLALTLWPGERADVVVSADAPPGGPGGPGGPAYQLSVRPADGKLAAAVVSLPFQDVGKDKSGRAASSPARTLDDVQVADSLEAVDLKGLDDIPEQLAGDDVDVRLYLPFDYQLLSGLRGDLSGPIPPAKPGSGPAPLGPADLPWPRAVPRMCNISMSLPAAPLLTQPREAEAYDGEGGAAVCRGEGRPATCPPHLHGGAEQSCECAHVIRVPLGSSVEIVLADQGGDGVDGSRPHVFQLHGHSFWVVGRGHGHGLQHHHQRGSAEALAAADQEGKLLRRHLHQPVRKDVVTVPTHGAAAIRFIADNPGYWLLREQSFYRWPAGLGVILQVGDQGDLPPVPSDFPKCGSFIGPEFFLM